MQSMRESQFEESALVLLRHASIHVDVVKEGAGPLLVAKLFHTCLTELGLVRCQDVSEMLIAGVHGDLVVAELARPANPGSGSGQGNRAAYRGRAVTPPCASMK